ncbi:MAG: GNAT family N-acetyltransferase [Pseudomonadota bacterium]
MQHFREAVLSDIEAIVKLVNIAYRGESSRVGWTTEADILDGLRTSANELECLIASENTIVLLCLNDDELLGSICLEKQSAIAHIGMFVVNPMMQANGIGKRLLTKAESLAQHMWDIEQFQMHVITIRHELIAFYERRGYMRTGILSEFPVNPEVWQPKLAGLQLEALEKFISK